MDSRTKAMIATAAAVLLCGCPGLFLCIFGAFTAAGSMPYSTEVNGVTNSGTLPPTVGFVLLCLSIIFILIPLAVGFFMFRRPAVPSAGNDQAPPTP